MIPRPRLTTRATLLAALLSVVACFCSEPARAIQLRWSTGTTDLTVAQDMQAVLLVLADSAEVTLPNTWRLQWTADTSLVQFSALDPNSACLVDTAKVDSVAPPSTPADSAANQITAYFCSSGSNNAAAAYFLVDLAANSHGKMRVVALDPNDTTQVVESNEVTFNGGVEGQYFPAILSVQSDHHTTVLRVDVVGSSLDALSSMSLSVPGLGAAVPLSVESHTNSLVVAAADVPMPLPACEVRFSASDHQFAYWEVPADHVPDTPLPYRWVFPKDTSIIYPKDFAFINTPLMVSGQWQSVYHLYYIRHYTDGGPRRNEYTFGHAWSRDLEHWNYNRNAFAIDSVTVGAWDGVNIWAPSIVRDGPTSFRMFYTGVSEAGDQSIGYASASSIDTIDAPGHWTRRTTATLTPTNALDWVKQAHPWAFRDPFVMADPENSGRFLLFYTAADSAYPSHNAVGVFQSLAGNLDSWTSRDCYAATEYGANSVSILESPHVFPDSSDHDPSQSAAATWRLMYTDGPWTDWLKAVLFNTKSIGASLTDTRASSWPGPVVGLGTYLGFALADTLVPEYGVQASEILQIGGTYFWGGYNGDELVFRKVRWRPAPNSTDFYLADVDFLAVDQRDLPSAAGLRLVGLRLGAGSVRFRVELPAPMRANMAVFDVMGRVVRPLADRDFAAGATEVVWDGRDRGGAAVRSGIYFARLRAGGASHVVRVPFVR